MKGEEVPCLIEPGFHATRKISFTAPDPGADDRKLYVVMKSVKDGQTVFVEDGVYLNVLAKMPLTSVKYLGTDDQTQGDWRGKYGSDGYEIEARECKWPSSVKIEWKSGSLWTYDKATDDKRALEYFANPPTGKDRMASGRYGSDVTFVMNVGTAARRLSLYHLDYDRKNRKQTVELKDAITGELLDQREIDNFAGGKYQSWHIQGGVSVTIHHVAGDNATIAGLFIDSAKE